MSRNYVVYPPGWPHRARARTFADLERAKRAARKMAREFGQPVSIYIVPRFGLRGGSARQIAVIHPEKPNAAATTDDYAPWAE